MTDNGMRAARRLLAAAALALLAGCSGQYWVDDRGVVVDPDPTVVTNGGGKHVRDRDRDGRRYVDGGKARDYGVPPGHMPPPGSCRVWFPDRPPGQQPPPGPCNVRVPRGAILVAG